MRNRNREGGRVRERKGDRKLLASIHIVRDKVHHKNREDKSGSGERERERRE